MCNMLAKLNMKTCFIYIRTAFIEPGKPSSSLRLQQQEIEKYAHKHGYKILGSFVDAGISGNSILRNGLQKLYNACSHKHVGAVIVRDIDRIARDYKILCQIQSEFENVGTKFIYTNGINKPHFFDYYHCSRKGELL
jgi:DNA invertase Pin-like site-specific DNA recombinase